jgi:hypothetical protein
MAAYVERRSLSTIEARIGTGRGRDGRSVGVNHLLPCKTMGARRESMLIDVQRSMAGSTGVAADGRNGSAFFLYELDSTKMSTARWLLQEPNFTPCWDLL